MEIPRQKPRVFSPIGKITMIFSNRDPKKEKISLFRLNLFFSLMVIKQTRDCATIKYNTQPLVIL